MNYRYKIENMDQFDPRHKDYGVILAEEHPEVEFSTRKIKQAVEMYLWYPYELNNHPSTFVEYHREKLAITDLDEARLEIDLWNDEISKGKLKKVSFSKVLTIADTRFGVIDLPGSSDAIVMMNRAGKFLYQKTIHAGSGGYGWQYLSATNKPSHFELKSKFNLDKAQGVQFIKNW